MFILPLHIARALYFKLMPMDGRMDDGDDLPVVMRILSSSATPPPGLEGDDNPQGLQ